MSQNKSFEPFTITCGDRLLCYDKPAVMGILNATPDSFYDGGKYTNEKQIVERALQIAGEGADIIDIGVVSTRPGAQMLTPDEEARRLAAAFKTVRHELPDAVISVDTTFSLPARAAVDAGADIINDISGGAFDPDMFQTVAELRTPYILMHNPYGTAEDPAGIRNIPPETPADITADAVLRLSTLNARLREMGVRDVIIDPGFGFSKTLDQNYRLLNRIGEFRTLFPNNPLLVALSRKSMIYRLLDTTPDDALTGTIALHTAALLQGAQLLRAHDVRATKQTIAVISKLTLNP